MEIIIGIVGILVTIFGGLAWLVMMLGHLKGRLDAPLENKQFFEQAEREFKQKLEMMLEAAQRRLNNDLNPEQILQKIETAQQQAMQQTEESLSGLKTALQDLEVAKQRALDEITQASSLEPLLTIEQRINQSVEEFRSKIAEVGNQADARRLALEQDAEQFLVKTQKQLVELEQQREKVTSEIAKVKSDALKELQQEVVKLKQLVMQPAELEQQREKVTSEIAKIKSDALKELQQEVVKLKQSVVQPADPVTDFAETLPEITFETAFIDNNKNIRRKTRKVRQLVETLPNDVKLEMIYVPGGTFMMGSYDEANNEKPVHSVTLKPFLVGKYPVTQAQWEAIMGSNPSNFKGANRPVETVTWEDAMQCCARLSQLTGHHYRLLSEAQWEYACRAGSVTKYGFGEIITPELANYNASGIKQTTDVGKYPANAFGLYDMHGNVWEWCEDVWHENYVGAPGDGSAWIAGGDSTYHLIRGGSWINNNSNLRCATRDRYMTLHGGNYRGFRFSRVNLSELEQQCEKVTSEIVKIKSDAPKELNQEIEELKQSVVQPADPLTDFAETLPEITFETAFIDNNKNIRRETRKARQLVEILPNNVKLEMIYVPGGTFMMGSEDYDDEKPIHQVTLKPFLVGKYPVTQAQWEAIMGSNPSNFKGANRPVEMVTWNDAMQCCARLSQLTGQHYRLLSEAQWEYACRAGSVTKYSFGEIITPALANYDVSGIKQTTDVGKYPANAFGLYDMHGNVWEWCEDVWHENYVGAPSDGSAWVSGDSKCHLRRGGSWSNFGDNYLRCAYRAWMTATNLGNLRGLRFSKVTL